MVTHGFTKHRSVVTNAKHHVNKNYVFNIDLKDFFPSIHQARIWKRLQYPPFNLKNEKIDIANLIANLVCFQFEKNDINKKNFLPQGAPTSPIISNIICERLDRKLFELAKEHNLKYTRYADDMTFSSDHNVYQENSEFLQKLHEIIKSENFEINPKKTRLQKRGYKQEVTGLIVNEKVNVSRVYIKNLRMLIHLVVKHGEEKAQSIFEKHSAVAVADLKLVIQGKLNYLKMVKGKNDTTYMTLHTKYLDAYKLIEVEVADTKHQEKVKIGNKKEKIINNCEHNPKELVRILSKFSDQNSALKWCVHSEGYEELYKGDYIYFMNCLEKEFKEIEDDIRRFSNRMYGKIYGFLFEKKLSFPKENKKYNYTWGDNKLEFGWSSPELKDWCLQSSNHIPFKFKLEDKYKKEINGETLSKFLHITTAFKNEIEVRSDNDALFNLIENIREEVLYEKKFNLEYNEEEILGLDFYTDIQWLSKGLKKIFEEIAKRGEYKIIKIYVKKDKDHFSVYIEHTSSYSKKESNELSKEINNGDFQDIKKYFCSLCDWSVEAKCLDGNYRINYLKSQGVEEIEKLANEPKGFTHILRFYK